MNIFIPFALSNKLNLDIIISYLHKTHYIQKIIYEADWGFNSDDYINFTCQYFKQNYNTLIYTNKLVLIPLIYTPSLNNLCVEYLTNEFNYEILLNSNIQDILKKYSCHITQNQEKQLILTANWLKPFKTFNAFLAQKYGAKDYLPKVYSQDYYNTINDYQEAINSLNKFKYLQNDLQIELFSSQQSIMLWANNFVLNENINFNFINTTLTNSFNIKTTNKNAHNIINLDIINQVHTNILNLNTNENLNQFLQSLDKVNFYTNNFILSNNNYVLILAPKTFTYKIFTPYKYKINLNNLLVKFNN